MTRLRAAEERAPTILVVEDDAAIVEVLNTLFALEGMEVVTADTGSRALELAQQAPIDVVVLDIMLPDITGYEVCARLRRAAGSPLPIVMLTALGRHDQVLRGLELGADDYMVKPFDPRELCLRISGLLRRSQAARAAERERSAWQADIHNTRAHAAAAEAEAAAARSDATVERTLRGEVIRNVSTHLNTLSNAADHTVRRFPAGPLREAADQLRQRIRGAALVYELSDAMQDELVDLGAVFRIAVHGIKVIYRPSRRVIAEVVGPSIAVPSVVAPPLAQMCTELVTNCFKHAFPDNRFGTVTVTYGVVDGHLAISVVDNGVGFDVAAASRGRGRSTVEALTYELGGSVNWSSGAEGTTVTLKCPLERPRIEPQAMPSTAA